jgi:transcriptional regulator with GAF, ATPase, and Fis domain
MVDDVAKIKSRRLTALLEVSQALGSTLDTRAAVEKVLEILDRELGMKRGAIALLEGEGDLKIQYAYGLSEGAAATRSMKASRAKWWRAGDPS